MACAATILSLPTELIVDIVKHCEEYDYPYDHNAKSTGRRDCPEQYEPVKFDRIPWVSASQSGKANICAIRLVCKQFRDAAYESFGTIISNRRFRLTRINMEDLEHIGSCEKLAPWIKTLTFGTAQLFDPSDQMVVREYLDVLLAAGVDKEQFQSKPLKESCAHAERMYKTVYDDMKPKVPLREVVKAFHNLENARIVVTDWPEYLAGWLTPQQNLALESYCGECGLHMDRCKIPLCGRQVRWGSRRFYCMHFEGPIITTIVNAGINFKDLRLTAGGDLFWKHDPFTRFLPASLRTLHMTVGDGFKREGLPIEAFDSTSGLQDLLQLTGLEDLSLTLGLDNPMSYSDDYSSHNEYFAATVFKFTKKASNLRRVALEGDWSFTQENFLAFVKEHASSLQSLILYGSILNGKWPAMLFELKHLTQDKLEFLRIIFPRAAAVGLAIEKENFCNYTSNEFPHFSCKTDFTSPDSPWYDA